ncbi:MAG: Monogalactosyldiacylglycerol synthase [Bryobacterales bacterium]|nr:Monogalactosyldiacylglycerol synthase [Bryobacterales bacterium]
MALRPTLDFIYFDAGGGHRSAALALQSVIQAEGHDWNVRLVNLQELLDPLDVFRKLTGVRLQDLYNLLLAKGWTLGSTYMLPMMHAVISMYHKQQVRLLTEYWRRQRPDMVVSVVPNFNRALFESLRLAAPDIPFVTVLTDFADCPPHFWVERQQQYFVCGTPRAAEQARERGDARAKVFLVSGMILRPEFYRAPEVDVAQERERLGLRADLPTGLVLFGGEGSNTMFSMAERLGDSSLDLQLVMICGRNEQLRHRLQKVKTRNRIYVEGLTKEVPYYMRLSDFFIGKPGPGSISEAIKLNLPVIVESNSWTLPQERYNADWVREQGVGEVLKNFRNIEDAVRDLLANGRLQAMKERVSRMDNRAVFEVVQILERILATHGKDQSHSQPGANRELPATHASDIDGSVPGELADIDPSRN